MAEKKFFKRLPVVLMIVCIVVSGFALAACGGTKGKISLYSDGELYKEFSGDTGTSITAVANPEKEGYRFDGWFTAEEGAGESYTLDKFPTGNVKLYAKWTKLYTLTFEAGDGATAVASAGAGAGETIPEPAEPQKSGYAFMGWFTETTGGEEVSFPYEVVGGGADNTTLYARWESGYRLTYFDRAGNRAKKALAAGTDIGATLIALSPEINGSIFLGWYDDATAGEPIATMPTRNTTVYIRYGTTEGLIVEEGVITGYEGTDTVAYIPKRTAEGEAIVEIGTGAFKDAGITEVYFVEGLTKIGADAFYGCEISEVYIPASVTELVPGAFIGCPLEKQTVAADNANYCSQNNIIYNKDKTQLHTYPKVNCPTIFTMPSTVTVVLEGAFFTSPVETVTFSSNLTELQKYSFAQTKIKSVNWSALTKLVTIGEGAFYGTPLAAVNIPASVTTVGDKAFVCYSEEEEPVGPPPPPPAPAALAAGARVPGFTTQTYTLATLTFAQGSTLNTIGKYAFGIEDTYGDGNTKLKAIALPASVTTVGEGAFARLEALEAFTFAGSLATIPDSMFFGCNALASITLPTGATKIEQYAFAGSGLTSVSLDGIVTIEQFSFQQSSLASVTIPASVTTIGDGAFSSCWNWEAGQKSLTSLTFAAGSVLRTIGAGAFSGNAIASVTIPKSVKVIGKEAFLGNYKMDDTGINHTFYLNSISFEADSVCEVIGYNAFAWSGITSITIPASVKFMGDKRSYDLDPATEGNEIAADDEEDVHAFKYCPKLTAITVDAANATFASSDGYVYYKNDTSFSTLVIGGAGNADADGNYTVPATVKRVGEFALSFLEKRGTLTIPATLEHIDDYAFFKSEFTRIVFADNGALTAIGNSAFASFWHLRGVDFGTGCRIATIGGSAFFAAGAQYYKLDAEGKVVMDGWTPVNEYLTITLPSSVTTIGDYAFGEGHVKTVIFTSSTLPTLGEKVFEINEFDWSTYDSIYFIDGFKIYVNAGLVDSAKTTWTAYADYIFDVATYEAPATT